MSVSFFATAFFRAAGEECTEHIVRVIFKTNVFLQVLFESTGQLTIAVVDAILRSRQEWRSNKSFS